MDIKINYDGWKFYDDMISKYGEYRENHYIYEYGHDYVLVEDIHGLSYEGVLRQNKLDRLYESIKRKGYLMNNSITLNLVYLPDRTYTVCEGGNHRPYLAKLLNIKRIRGYIDILIPKNILTSKQVKECEKILNESECGVDTTHPYFYELCKQYDLIPSPIKINIR